MTDTDKPARRHDDGICVQWPELREFCREKQNGCLLLRQEQERARVPSTRWTVAVMLFGAIGICTTLFIYLGTNLIRDYDTTVRDRYVSIPRHEQDIREIKDRLATTEARILAGQNDLVTRIEEIMKRGR